ncbi:bifunctional UDP-N-acetylmuramoyl-tripeptide:D-alanyl-D-alanine ligase/alanine racemase [Sphingobacterium sp. UT-1RO-CII-1]|uniref:bifunctional UDP-N-acetylmuramoyl-tripeptide:D-alanyl-D-alanine ligase/alanine racemase n=1 Tax=Sphingobacterium sp. UT-1RO-CII-1 TaxID=2995225 RepID=UPI00227C50FB|nr:bifunctional UDP-N-acetylmuramoyl-tripeptide:D-alanyl-D-alanine ligase/alanine racemase [Sphingobacterium sp. UT-1RO-CII-1]MCY4781233.1 bifunctional UDP-N-acetylmuramoyl-tripeptide:D-alanyl-D-alanine ligase/alanine racemase [Sphingobacterium sp. UT-1RO-CII-1]
MYTIESILNSISFKRKYIFDAEMSIISLAYDSRKIRSGGESLFFALKNIRDGHEFIADAYSKGVRSFVVDREDFDTSAFLEANFIWVEDVLAALQSLVRKHRGLYTKPLIGITGSNGKTVVKEWLTELLLPDSKVYQSPKSYNSQLGVALSLWNLTEDYEYAIIEAGISKPGEMALLEEMIKPTIGVFTNIGTAHSSGFASKEQKIKEKLKLFKEAEVIIYSSRYDIKSYIPAGVKSFTFGEENEDDVQVLAVDQNSLGQTNLRVCFLGEVQLFELPFNDRASIENSLICLSTLLFLGYSLKELAQRVFKMKPVEMRLNLNKGKNNCSIIDDSYSNDIASLQVALDFLHQQQQHAKKTLILSDMEGLNEKLKVKLKDLLQEQELDRVILVGDKLAYLKDYIAGEVTLYSSTEQLVDQLSHIEFFDESILIKGGRLYHLEDVSRLLVAKSHETVLEINLNALVHNLQQYRRLLAPGVKTMAMVKAFSYGSGSFEVANLLQFNKVDYLTVAFADEGAELRQNGINLPIMVLSPDEQDFENLLVNKLEPEIYNFRILNAFVRFLRSKGVDRFPIHLKIDTGMHRLGFLPEEVEELGELLLKSKEVYVKSALSHLVASGNRKHDVFTQQQITMYKGVTQRLRDLLDYDFIEHIANTSAIVDWKSAHLDMVRLGIGLYGVNTGSGKLALEPVGQLKTTITQIKELKAGETVGYERSATLQRDSRIATIKIGYADGYDRRFGNGVGLMSVNGHIVKTVGSICMDMCMLDVTDIRVREEDEVIVYPDLTKAAEAIGTIPYELLVNVSTRVKRMYFYG